MIKLPVAAWVQTPTPDLAKSRHFYEALGFKEIEGSPNFFWDGRVCIEVNPHPHARTGIKVSANFLADECSIKFPAVDPNGVKLYSDTEPDRKLPTMGEPFGKLGRHAVLSVESHDVSGTVAWWEAKGFTAKVRNYGAPYFELGGGLELELMKQGCCGHFSPSPGLTYFNSGENAKVIAEIRKAEIPITQELTMFSDDGSLKDVIIYDPGLTGFFVFND